MPKLNPAEITTEKLGDILWSGGHHFYEADFHLNAPLVLHALRNRWITVEERDIPSHRNLSKRERKIAEHIDNSSRHNHGEGEEIARLICGNFDIDDNLNQPTKLTKKRRNQNLLTVLPNAWYGGGRCDVALIELGSSGDDYTVVVAIEIGNVYIRKPVNAFASKKTKELWVIPYSDDGKYYVFRRGEKFENMRHLERQTVNTAYRKAFG